MLAKKMLVSIPRATAEPGTVRPAPFTLAALDDDRESMKLRPENFEPPYPAFTCELFGLRPDLTLAQIGLQYSAGGSEHVRELRARVEASLGGEAAPLSWERCTHVDAEGYRNDVTLAYWQREADFLDWRRRADVAAWADVVQPIGVWLEALSCPIPQMETSYSNEEPTWGVAPRCPVHLDPNHGYFGSMRDRIPAAEDKGLPAGLDRLSSTDIRHDSFGKHLRLHLPDNLCFIRTVQGWEDCDSRQQEDFAASMLPVYRAGVEYLRDNPRDTNCISARLVDMLDEGAQIQTQTLAWFVGLADLERWAHEHPTHHAILNGMAAFAERYDLDIQVVLGHEVYVVPAGHSHVEYTNCHPRTGFLRFFEAEAVPA